MNWFERNESIWVLFGLGVLLRLLVFSVITASGVDPHAEVIEFIAVRHRIPLAHEIYNGAHPPLYYLISVPFYLLDDPKLLKLTQLPALLMGVLNLWLLAKVLLQTTAHALARNLSYLLLAVCSPPFLTYSLYISNDSLAFLMGTVLFYVLWRYAQDPRRTYELALGVLVGLAISTKLTLLPLAGAAGLFILVVRWRNAEPWAERLIALLAFALLVGVFGGFKFIQNKHYEHRFLLHVMDFYPLPWQEFYLGWRSLLNFNLPDLMLHPNFSDAHATRHSLPLLLYATMWYKHIYFENNLTFGNYSPFRYLAAFIYALGLLPTGAMIAGVGYQLKTRLTGLVASWRGTSPLPFRVNLWELLVIGLTLLGIFALFASGIRYNSWSYLHARLFGHYWLGILLFSVWGLTWVQARFPRLFRFVALGYLTLAALYLLHFSVEVGVRYWLWAQTGDWAARMPYIDPRWE
jgi:hypothetical protein